jgi:amino acid transporter
MDQTIKPPRTVGLFGTALLPLNGMIGAGIFALPAILYAAVGSFAPWMILLGGILFFPLMFVFASLAKRFDHSGGPMLYGEAAFGPFVGFQAGWMRYASALASMAANAHVVISYLAALWPVLDDPVVRPVAVALFILAFTLINLFGMTKAIGVLGSMTLVKLLPLAGLVIAGLAMGSPAIGFALPEFTAFETVVLLTFYAFIGFENVSMPAGEMRKPKRDIPMALMGILLFVTLFYMLIIWAYIAIDPVGSSDTMPLAIAAEAIMGQVGAVAIVVAAAFSIGANTLGGFVALPRMTYGMAEEGMLPPIFMRVSKRFLTPDFSILFLGGVAMLVGLSGSFVFLAVAGTLSRIVTYLICVLALPVIEWQEAKAGTGPRFSFDTLMAALALISCLWVGSQASGLAFLTLAGILVVGSLLYILGRMSAKRATLAA